MRPKSAFYESKMVQMDLESIISIKNYGTTFSGGICSLFSVRLLGA